MNRESDNFTAEILLKHLGAARGAGGHDRRRRGGRPAARSPRPASRSAGVRIVDGSGLSLLDRLTADALVALLVAAWDDPLLRGSFLALARRRGPERDAASTGCASRRRSGQVFAKTGTTRLASALSGYVGGRYAFAVVQNGPPLSPWWARTAQDRFVTVLARS